MTAAVIPPSEGASIPRAASYTFLPALKETTYDEVKGTFFEDDLIGQKATTFELQLTHEVSDPSAPGTESDDFQEYADTVTEIGDTKPSTKTLPKLDTGAEPERTSRDREFYNSTQQSTTPVEGSARRPSFSRSLSQRLRSQSWMQGSRSPSPSKAVSRDQSPAGTIPRTPNRLARRSRPTDANSKTSPSRRSSSLSRKGTDFARKFGRSVSTMTNGVASECTTPVEQVSSASTGLPKSWSSEKLPLPVALRSIPSSERVPPVPRVGSSDKLRSFKPDFRKKDELWSVFRTLDGDVQKFNAKPSTLKANMVRTSLLPFLRNYRSHESSLKLRPEDLDRRTNILNKWWTGLLELLLGRNNQSISATERPIIFEAITGIMERPEWRVAPSPFCALRDKKFSNPASRSASSTSLSSDESDFLQESVNHNIRNNFVQNLLAQMNFVIWRMSERNTPASVVQFCGKTIAYAFFFCDGVADALVRLWEPSMDLLKRVVSESGVKGLATLDAVSKSIVTGFPPALHALEFVDPLSTYRNLGKPLAPPLGTHDAPWNSRSWINRWNGKETELFYVFVKHYHLLLMDFLPEHSTKKERLVAPGVVIVHAQILANLDGTIHRHTAYDRDEAQRGASNITFDDVLGGDPDVSAPALPFAPTTNANRLMTENRLIMLVRDFLSDRNPMAARRVFAEAFSDILKAAARRTIVFDHGACYTLCDFLEEAIVILVRYEHATELEHSVLDFSFWLDVFKRMIQSQNTTTEIRLYALIYSLWSSITTDPYRKRDLCRSLLLEPNFFNGRFNHWCPMVRTYYMRLLCWRVGRYDGDGDPRDIDIFRMLSERLNTVYGHYVYLREDAQLRYTHEPSTTPCNPAPGRCFIIMRTDPLISTARGLSSFTMDGFSSPVSTSFRLLPTVDFRPTSGGSTSSSEQEDDAAKRWGILRTIIGTTKQQRARSASPTTRARDSTARASSSPVRKPSPLAAQQPQQPPFRTFCFKFSLESTERRRADPTPMRLLAPRLPGPAHALLHGHGAAAEPRAVPPSPAARPSAKYAGRALAEWELVVWECQSFFERRRAEGVPANASVETPTLGVEAFRRPG